MAGAAMKRVVGCLRRVTLACDDGMTDGQLLERFLAASDEAAFTALVQRHGPMVMGVCRRMLGNRHDAEDAFQASFLVLARKASAIGRRDLLGHWLYGVAYRTALKARATAGRRRAVERQVEHMPEREARAEKYWDDLQSLLDAELDRLPEKYRIPVVLCGIEGKSKREVARALGVPEGTVSSRLARANKMLRQRLTRRGLALSSGALTLALSVDALSASVPPALLYSTSEAATATATGGAATSSASAKVAALAEGVLKTMFLQKLKLTAALALALAAAGAGMALVSVASEAPVGLAMRTPAAYQDAAKDAEAKPSQWAEVSSWACVVPGAVAFSPDGKKLAAGAAFGNFSEVLLWDVASGESLNGLRGDADSRGLYTVAFSPDGKQIATGDPDGLVTLWDLATSNKAFDLKGHGNEAVRSVAFAPDGKTLASAGADGVVKLWDVAQGRERASLQGHTGPVGAVTFAPNGKTVATGSNDNTIKLWDAASGQELATLKGSAGRVDCVAFSPDGKTLASGSADGTLKLWDPTTGKERATLRAGRGRVDAVAFAPDGRTLAATGYEVKDKEVTAVVTLWDPATGKERTALRAEMGLPTGISFDRSGTKLALSGFAVRDDPVMSGEGVVKVWQLRK